MCNHVTKTTKVIENSEKNGKTSHPRRQASKPKNRWFDASCIAMKREVNKLANRYGRQPKNETIRLNYYTKKKEYKMYIKKKKYAFYKKINEDILQDNNISWKEFKKLKDSTKEDPVLDLYDIGNFYSFFQALYKPKVLDNSDLY